MAHPPKVTSGAGGLEAVFEDAASAGQVVAQLASQLVTGPWRAYAVAVGQSAPANITRLQIATRAIKGSTR